MECLYCIHQFPLVGDMIIVANDTGESLFYTEFVGRVKIEKQWKKVEPEEVEIIKQAIQQLKEFFLGERKSFDLKLEYVKATEFDKVRRISKEFNFPRKFGRDSKKYLLV